MPPLFACAGCGLQIERSTRLYLRLRGRVLCSTCLDRQEEAGDRPEAADRPEPGSTGATEAREGG
jgi:hypothetical protein